MSRIIFLFILSFTFCGAFAQPVNNWYDKAIPLPNSSQCSADAAYTNVNATDEGQLGTGNQWPAGQTGKDVWFSFVAALTDVEITVTGASTGGGSTGGTLVDPLIAVYTINKAATGISYSEQIGSFVEDKNIASFYKGALVPSTTYYVRVSAANNNTGTFKICINNYLPPEQPGQDFSTAGTLCDKRTFTQMNVAGAGVNNKETAGSCLGQESNSVWYKWTAANSGTLTMDITPTVNTDDIDWVLYDLGPSGNFNNKVLIRCASGHGVNNQGCPNEPLYFKTGMRTSSSDISEQSGCGQGQDGYVKAADMVAGRTYALLVDNFSNGNNGFKVEFGGTAEFQGPKPKINMTRIQPCTINQNFTFTSTGSVGYSSLKWFFGEGASTATSTVDGSHTISYSTPGLKTVVLQVFSPEGCSVGITETFLVGLKPELPLISGLKSNYCIGETIDLSTSELADATYSWTGPGGFQSGDREIKIPVDDPARAGTYRLTVTVFGCTSDAASVTVPPIGQSPTAAFTVSIINACTAQQAYTFTSTSTDYQRLRWDFGPGASVAPGAAGTSYTVTYSSPGQRTVLLRAEGNTGCISNASQDITVALTPLQPVIIANKPDFCLTDTIRLSTADQLGVTYSWTGPQNFSSNQRSIEIPVTSTAVAGVYTLVLTSGTCTTTPVSVTIPPIFNNPVAEFTAEPPIPSKLSFPIAVQFFNQSVDADIFLWDFGDGNTSTEANPKHTYTSEGEFEVTLTAFKSTICSSSIVKGKFVISPDNAIFIPNTFTPNNDGLNDEFVVNMSNIKTYRINIYSRYGIHLFTSESLFENWDGLYKNEPLPVGTYYYVVDAIDYSQNVIKRSGSITILR